MQELPGGTLRLEEVTLTNWREAMQLRVRPDQLPFIAEVEPIAMLGLAKAHVGILGHQCIPYAFLTGDEMVGFTLVSYDRDGERSCWLHHFFIDAKHQGRGYGREAMRLVLDLLHERFAESMAVYLTVNAENEVAKRLYRAAGFEPTGDMKWDDLLYRRSLR